MDACKMRGSPALVIRPKLLEEMLALDYRYVTHWSLWQDVSLLIRTIPQVLRGSGAAQ